MMFLGLDVGTQGVRCMVTDEKGAVLAQSSVPFATLNSADTAKHPERREQKPQDWWNAARDALLAVTRDMRERSLDPAGIAAMAIDGTSGTVLALDAAGEPLTDGVMYNDARTGDEALAVQQAGEAVASKLGYKFGASYALPRLLWWQRHQRDVFERAARFVHQTDYLVLRLCGEYVSDFSNALKTGYDFEAGEWPAFISQKLGIAPQKLPRIVAPGMPIAPISAAAARETGLSTRTQLVAGATDGYVSAIATGAVAPGEFTSVIGTTLVLKGVTTRLIRDPLGRVYCHKHPQGYYMPGGAGNVGGLCLREAFPDADYDALNAAVPALTPTGLVCYPLTGRGERFPFIHSDAVGFFTQEPSSRQQRYAALLEGVACVERLSYELLTHLGADVGDTIRISGGAVNSAPWSQIRADMLGKTLLQTSTDAGVGSAMLAAMHVMGSLQTVARAMVRETARFEPDARRRGAYDAQYARFVEALRERGYIA